MGKLTTADLAVGRDLVASPRWGVASGSHIIPGVTYRIKSLYTNPTRTSLGAVFADITVEKCSNAQCPLVLSGQGCGTWYASDDWFYSPSPTVQIKAITDAVDRLLSADEPVAPPSKSKSCDCDLGAGRGLVVTRGCRFMRRPDDSGHFHR